MGTLASELAPHAERISLRPRLYADANIPARLVAHMRQALPLDGRTLQVHTDWRRDV